MISCNYECGEPKRKQWTKQRADEWKSFSLTSGKEEGHTHSHTDMSTRIRKYWSAHTFLVNVHILISIQRHSFNGRSAPKTKGREETNMKIIRNMCNAKKRWMAQGWAECEVVPYICVCLCVWHRWHNHTCRLYNFHVIRNALNIKLDALLSCHIF